MPIFGVGIHIIIAIFFAIHAVRKGQQLYWLLILFSFPLIGSIVYFFAIYLPDLRLQRGVSQVGAVIQKSLDPGRELREARAAFDLTPTANNQMRLASALFEAGQLADAVAQYDNCLKGPFGKDAVIGLGAAQARLANKEPQVAVELLQAVMGNHPGFRPEQVGLMLAKALSGAGRQAEAGDQFLAMATRFASAESHGEYAIWAIENGARAVADKQLAELAHLRRHMTRYTQDLHKDLLRRVDAASATLR